MSATASTSARGPARQLLSAAGLLPLARRAARLSIDLRCAFRRQFRLTIDRKEVRFRTTDPQSNRFFHRRYRQGELHEPPVTAELTRRARAANVFADVGAHIAYYSCIAGAVNDRLQLCLFEMNRELIPVIERNLAENRLMDAVIVDRPVADRRRMVSYASASGEPGLSMRDPARRGDGQGILVETLALDEFFAERGAWPDLIKIDVEGAELAVLEGARRILAQHHPVLFVEVHPGLLGSFDASAEQVYALLRTHGYTIQRFAGHRNNGTGLQPVPATAAIPNITHMLLCV